MTASPTSLPTAPTPLSGGTGTWLLRPWAVWLVISLELRQRVRSVRWYVALGLWTLFLLGMSGLLVAATMAFSVEDPRGVGSLLFSLVVLLTVFTLMLVLPALSAGAINGDRTAGTLATLQATLLSPVEIVAGKVLAGWIVGLAFIAAALPAMLPLALLALNSPLYVLRVLIMLAVLSLLVTMVGVGMSSLASRQLGSVVLTYLLVMGTMFILPIAFGALTILATEERVVTSYTEEYADVGTATAIPTCEARDEEQTIIRTDLTLPLLWGNPFVLVADMAPDFRDDAGVVDLDAAPDALVLIREGMRLGADPTHPSNFVYCEEGSEGYPTDIGTPRSAPVWFKGLALWTIAGVGSTLLAVRRLRVPMRRVGAGTRIA